MLEIPPPQFPCAKVRFAHVSNVYCNFKSNLHCLINVCVVDNDALTSIKKCHTQTTAKGTEADSPVQNRTTESLDS